MKRFANITISIIFGVFAGYFIVYWLSELWLGEFLTTRYNNEPQPWQPPLIGALIWLFFSIATGYISYKYLPLKNKKKHNIGL
jgi:membrane protein DedA with SNARE-associated domain